MNKSISNQYKNGYNNNGTYGGCPRCGNSLIWGGDFDFEDYGYEGEGLVSNFICGNPKCNTFLEVYTKYDNEGEE